MSRRMPAGVFVTTDSPEYLERDVNPAAKLVDLSTQNCRQIRDAWLIRQRDYQTTPCDPTGEHLRLFPGGVTIWSGFPGAGKTTLLRQLVCHLLHRGQGVFMASLEEPPDDLFVRLACSAAGTIEPTEAQLEWFVFAYAERLRLWGVIGLARHLELLALIRVLAREHGIRHAVIDSLMALDVDSTDWEAQRQFAIAVTTTARMSGAHIHLVAHPRKPSSEQRYGADLNDVAGSADLGRLADNIVFVQRAKGEELLSSDVTPMKIAIRKQRHGTGACGDIDGYYHRNLRQYHPGAADRPTSYLPPEATATTRRPL
jgi:twinkle protein